MNVTKPQKFPSLQQNNYVLIISNDETDKNEIYVVRYLARIIQSQVQMIGRFLLPMRRSGSILTSILCVILCFFSSHVLLVNLTFCCVQ